MLKKIFCLAFFCCLATGGDALAYQVENFSNTPILGDFLVGPVKIEAEGAPGQIIIKDINIFNRTGRNLDFTVEKEDFSASPDPSGGFVFLEEKNGEYSLKSAIVPEISEFSLAHGQRLVLPIKIQMPLGIASRGLNSAIFIAGRFSDQADFSQTNALTRVAVLFFAKGRDSVKNDGWLEMFQSDKKIYWNNPVSFKLYFKNNGATFLAPSGKIEIKNILGGRVQELPVEKIYVLPSSLRLVKISWNSKLGIGAYKARISLDRGYKDAFGQNLLDVKELIFYVFPPAYFIGLGVILCLGFWLFLKAKKKSYNK